MTLDDFARLGESAGIIAVFVTLVYLAIQVRQNNRETRDQTAWRITESINHLAAVVADVDAADVWCRGNDDFDSLSRVDRERYVIMVAMWHNVLLALYRTKDTSAVPAEYWEHNLDTFAIYYAQYPGFKQAVGYVNVPDPLLSEIERRLSQVPSRPTTGQTKVEHGLAASPASESPEENSPAEAT